MTNPARALEPTSGLSATGSRSVAKLVPAARTYEGAGFEVNRPFPTARLDAVDPFLLLDEMGPQELAPGQARGAPDHPHRGFETVTYVLAGKLEHRDSRGNSGSLGPGDVQWMTAGAGVVHSEMPARELVEQGGRMHGFQLWVNLPAHDKLMPPRYQEISAQAIPEARSQDGAVTARVIAGEALGARAVIDTRTPITYLHLTLAPGASFDQPVAPGHNAFAYIIEGGGRFGRDRVAAVAHTAVVFGRDGDEVRISVPDDVRSPLELLLIAGQPLEEPIARYGPFVMNSWAEIEEAFTDYHSGLMGRIPANVDRM